MSTRLTPEREAEIRRRFTGELVDVLLAEIDALRKEAAILKEERDRLRVLTIGGIQTSVLLEPGVKADLVAKWQGSFAERDEALAAVSKG